LKKGQLSMNVWFLWRLSNGLPTRWFTSPKQIT